MTIHAFQLPSGDGWLHATLTLPPRPQARAAVLICPPLVEERKASQRAMVDGARHLAEAAACVVLRIDYRGCGDSSGMFEATGVGDWRSDTERAADWLRAAFPGLPQIRLGIRAGALLAGTEDTDASAMVIWEPVAGEAFIRQLLQRRMVNDMIAYGRARASRAALDATLKQGGSVDLDGYTVTGAQVAGLAALPLPATRLPGLVILTGADTRTTEALGRQAPLLDCVTHRLAPFWNSVGHVDTQPLAEATSQWIQKHFDTLHAISPVSLPSPVAPLEAPVTIPAREGELRAILHRPPVDPPREAFLFLGGWSGDRQGPHRLFSCSRAAWRRRVICACVWTTAVEARATARWPRRASGRWSTTPRPPSTGSGSNCRPARRSRSSRSVRAARWRSARPSGNRASTGSCSGRRR